MSKGIRRSLQPSLLASKRFIVSACAAIAMVMGAMSVGASLFEHSEPSDHHQQAEASAIFGPDTNKTEPSPDKEPTSPLKAQKTLPEQTLAPENKTTVFETVSVVPGTLSVLKEIIQTPLLTNKLPLKIDAIPFVPDIVPENIIPTTPLTKEIVMPPEQTIVPAPAPIEPSPLPAEDQPGDLGIHSAPENPTE